MSKIEDQKNQDMSNSPDNLSRSTSFVDDRASVGSHHCMSRQQSGLASEMEALQQMVSSVRIVLLCGCYGDDLVVHRYRDSDDRFSSLQVRGLQSDQQELG